MDRSERASRKLYLALCVPYLMWAAWTTTPEHQQQAAKLRLLRWCGLVTSRLARHAAAASMRRELATGEQLYSVPLYLSLWRAALDRAYEQARGVTP